MKGPIRWLIVIVLLAAFAVWVALPGTIITNVSATCYQGTDSTPAPEQGIHLDFNGDCDEDFSLNVRQALGLDLVGGLRVLLQAELPPGTYTIDDLRQAANNVERRVNALGVGEATVQVQGSDRILVELPGVTDSCQAINTIQKTALLEFVDFGGLGSQVNQLTGRSILTTQQQLIQQQRDQANTAEPTVEATVDAPPTSEATAEATAEPASGGGAAATATDTGDENPCASDANLAGDAAEQPILNPATGQPFTTVITGAGLQAASAQIDPQGRWVIQFELTPEGGQVFGPFTASRIGQPLAIVLDGVVLSAPTIQAQLDTGGTITGSFTEDEAKELALQLRSGALPIPLRVESAETVGATLGQESVNLSIQAGIIGVLIVLTFMLVYYRVPGVAAALALLVFIILNLAVFKLIPITLTLPAIVGFLISIGTAVDGNILIFERVKEELRSGSPLDSALTAGFDRAWASIRDSNFSTIIICVILFLFGQTPGASIVSGFALTLMLGLIINLFTAVVVTRTFLYILVAILRQTLTQRHWLLGV
jgi:preprotein translocase subunit SecD